MSRRQPGHEPFNEPLHDCLPTEGKRREAMCGRKSSVSKMRGPERGGGGGVKAEMRKRSVQLLAVLAKLTVTRRFASTKL